MPLVGAEPGAIEQQELQPEDVIDHEEEQHEEQRHAEAAAQLHGGQRHCTQAQRGLTSPPDPPAPL